MTGMHRRITQLNSRYSGPSRESSIPALTPKSYELCEHGCSGPRKRGRRRGSKDQIFEVRIETVDGIRTRYQYQESRSEREKRTVESLTRGSTAQAVVGADSWSNRQSQVSSSAPPWAPSTPHRQEVRPITTDPPLPQVYYQMAFRSQLFISSIPRRVRSAFRCRRSFREKKRKKKKRDRERMGRERAREVAVGFPFFFL